MAKRRLTDRTLKALPPATGKRRHYDVWDDLVQGFGVRVHMNGRKSFQLMARYPGSKNPTRRALGQYENGMTLESARRKAGEWRQLLADGVDPKVETERKVREEARARSDSFATVVAAYIIYYKRSHRSWRDVERCLDREFTSKWAKRPIRDITRRDVIEVLEAIVKREVPAAARNALAYLRSMFNWACDRYDLETSPCDRIKPKRIVGTSKARQRTLTDDELRSFWATTGNMEYPFGPFLRMLLLTGARRSEVGGARWREFDMKAKVWTVPPERFKSDATHLVPLTDDVIALLESLPRFKHGDHLFSTTAGAKPVSGYSKAKAIVDRGMSAPAWRLHDLRRTVRTHLAALKIPDVTAEMVIGHGRKGIQRVYDLHQYQPEMREALTLWAGRLRDITTPAPANVVKLAKAR